MRAIMISVDYTDLLSITLPYNRHHFTDVYVVTSTADAHNVGPVADANSARMLVTDAFYHDGASFNKWKALETALDRIGRYSSSDPWWCLMDADVLWPKVAPLTPYLRRGCLYGPRRRICDPIPPIIPREAEWMRYPIHRQEKELAGYSQIFHCEDPHLGSPPWHQTDWKHAGGADSFFQAKWPEHSKVRPPFTVLHLGPAGENWCGRVTPYLHGGGLHTESGKRAERLKEFFAGRVGKPRGERYNHERLGG